MTEVTQKGSQPIKSCEQHREGTRREGGSKSGKTELHYTDS